MQRHVDSRRDAGRRDHICIVNEPLVGADLDSWVKFGELVQRAPVRRGGPVREQTGGRALYIRGHAEEPDTLIAAEPVSDDYCGDSPWAFVRARSTRLSLPFRQK